MLITLGEVREFRRVVESFPHIVASHVWIADGGGSRFVPWAWQVRLARVWRERRQVVILKGRQLGVSWLAAAYALWMALSEPWGIHHGDTESRRRRAGHYRGREAGLADDERHQAADD